MCGHIMARKSELCLINNTLNLKHYSVKHRCTKTVGGIISAQRWALEMISRVLKQGTHLDINYQTGGTLLNNGC